MHTAVNNTARSKQNRTKRHVLFFALLRILERARACAEVVDEIHGQRRKANAAKHNQEDPANPRHQRNKVHDNSGSNGDFGLHAETLDSNSMRNRSRNNQPGGRGTINNTKKQRKGKRHTSVPQPDSAGVAAGMSGAYKVMTGISV